MEQQAKDGMVENESRIGSDGIEEDKQNGCRRDSRGSGIMGLY